ncbi:hypothetical protein SteCoe_33516 [Stentor coeruleus]|uniref:Uncharacterized protein n=1 Tax=Stentor coeruleus TaxID=5963 RepID=A0A1R2AWI7_9CILI|nr:hypothetical protein SteCoe_33516 [Stentor coeruleus]
MNSPLHNSPSDFSTPKPIFGRPSEDFTSEEFIRYLQSLNEDINCLGKEVESLRNENVMLKGQLEVIKKEKEKHIYSHVKEKHELEKALQIEQKLRKDSMRELQQLKTKFRSYYESQTRSKNENSFRDMSSDKSLKVKRPKPNDEIKNKLWRLEKEHKEMKKKLKEIQSKSISYKKTEETWEDD